MTWTDFWDALQRTHALPSAGATLAITGATFRWFEDVCGFLARVLGGFEDPFARSREYVARLRAVGDERTIRQVEERLQGQRRLLTRYGRAMMVAGVAIVALSVLLR